MVFAMVALEAPAQGGDGRCCQSRPGLQDGRITPERYTRSRWGSGMAPGAPPSIPVCGDPMRSSTPNGPTSSATTTSPSRSASRSRSSNGSARLRSHPTGRRGRTRPLRARSGRRGSTSSARPPSSSPRLPSRMGRGPDQRLSPRPMDRAAARATPSPAVPRRVVTAALTLAACRALAWRVARRECPALERAGGALPTRSKARPMRSSSHLAASCTAPLSPLGNSSDRIRASRRLDARAQTPAPVPCPDAPA